MNQDDPKEDISNTDPFVQKFFARIPPKTAASFTSKQLAELKKVFKARIDKQHSVDIRLSLPILKRRFYLVLLLGKENRLANRAQAGVRKPANKIVLTLTWLLLITSLLGTLHIANKMWGINSIAEQAIKKSFPGLLKQD